MSDEPVYLDHDELIRLEALNLANQDLNQTTDKIVSRAKNYESFLKGE